MQAGCDFTVWPDGTVAATLSGELDADSVVELAPALMTMHPDLIDARGVVFFSAAGVSLLLRASRSGGIDVVASPIVARMIALCGLEEHLRIVEGSPAQHEPTLGV